MPFQCPPASALRLPPEEAERPTLVLQVDANREAAHAHPQPGQAEGRSSGTQTAPLSAREVRWARRKRQVERPLPVLQSNPCFPREPSPQPALGLRSRAAVRRPALYSVFGSASVNCSSPAAERPAAADIRIRAAPPYPRDRVARNETRAGRLPSPDKCDRRAIQRQLPTPCCRAARARRYCPDCPR